MRKFAPVTVTACLVSSAMAQLIVGNDQSGTATIWNVDPSGVNPPQALYSDSTNMAKPWGMAYDPQTNTLYWNNGSRLYASPFGQTLTPVELGTMMYGASTINFVGLGFKGGKLYGTRNISVEAVYEIDPVTLQATLVYQYNSAYDFGGLDFDATTGHLYGLSDTAPSGQVAGLYLIDYIGQSTTFKAPYPTGETDIDGLAVHNGIAYYVTDGPNTSQPYFYIFDVATGQQLGTIPSPFTGSGTFCAAAYVPEPAGLVLMVAALALIRRR
jgi:hypothetical protein